MTSLKLTMDIEGSIEELWPTVEWAVESELMTEDEAASLIADEILKTMVLHVIEEDDQPKE